MNAPEDMGQAPHSIAEWIHTQLAPLAERIDQEAFYPEAFLRQLGALGAFRGGGDARDSQRFNVAGEIDLITRVGRVCGSTAFLAWCQSACAWYLQHAPAAAVRARYLAPVAGGDLLAGSGMSNAMKHLAGIEKMRLVARRQADGYVVSGVLPWVSNLGEDHLLITAATVGEGGHVMFASECGTAGLTLHACPDFSGMRGTQTFNVRFKEVAVAADQVLAPPTQFDAYFARIGPGLLLNQAGMGFGIAEGCLDTLRESGASHASVNRFLDDQEQSLHIQLDALQARAVSLARQAQAGASAMLPVLRLRAEASELALRAANAAVLHAGARGGTRGNSLPAWTNCVLHAGARGYLLRHPAQRRLREAVFVAIVTPALKHLRKAIHDLESVESQTEVA